MANREEDCYLPSQEEIREACAEIRSGWPRCRFPNEEPPRVEVHVISAKGLGLDSMMPEFYETL